MPTKTLSVMISSTVPDLQEYRLAARDACNLLGMVPVMMEHLPALPIDGTVASREMVEPVDVYVGIFAHRYGSQAAGEPISITEMEYNLAAKKELPCLIFMMRDNVPVRPADIDTGESAERLESLKKRLSRAVVYSKFSGLEELRFNVYRSLQECQKRLPLHTPSPSDRGRQVSRLTESSRGDRPSSLEGLESKMRGFYDQMQQDDKEQAFKTFRDSLFWPLMQRAAGQETLDLLLQLFPRGLESLDPQLEHPADRSYALTVLGLSWLAVGRPGLSCSAFERAVSIDRDQRRDRSLIISLRNWAKSFVLSGHLAAASEILQEAEHLAEDLYQKGADDQSGWLLLDLFHLRMLCGGLDAEPAQKALGIFTKDGDRNHRRGQEMAHALLTQRRLWRSLQEYPGEVDPSTPSYQDFKQNLDHASEGAEQALRLAQATDHRLGVIRAYRLRGQVAIVHRGEGDLKYGAERLISALREAKQYPWREEEIACRIALAEICYRRGDLVEARELLDETWQPIREGPFPLFEADAHLLLSRLEQAEHRTARAVDAAWRAYRTAWCDGPPFAYHWGLLAARRQLVALGLPEPLMAKKPLEA